MKQYKINFILILMACFIAGVLFGRYVFLGKEVIPISERIEACEAKGGKYDLMYWGNEYHEGCKIFSKDIEDF